MEFLDLDLVQLEESCSLMASNHDLKVLTGKSFTQVTHHVLMDGGKDGLGCLADGLITEVELRNLYMTHVWDEITRPEIAYCVESEELNLSFDMALFGRPAKS